MKYSAFVFLFTLLAAGCGGTETITRLQTDQKLLKDSADNISEKIGQYIQKGMNDSAVIQKKQLAAVHARLAAIQAEIDSRAK